MRADRLLSILLLLQVNRRVTARELATRLEVSERTIYRDMDALGAAGVPVTADRGCGGGWGLLATYRTNLTGLNLAEVQALFLPQPAGILADLGLRQAAEGALIKLLATLPALARQSAEYVRERIHIDAAGWHQIEESVPAFPAVQEALWQERKLYLSYARGDGAVVERLVDPLGLVAKGRIWYLVAGVEDELRTYRVSRMREARPDQAPCVRPPGFDLAAYWEAETARFLADLPRYPTTLRVAPDAVARLRRGGHYSRVEHVGDPDADGWVPCAVVFDAAHEACEFVLSLGPQIVVVDPAALRARVIAAAAGITALYPDAG